MRAFLCSALAVALCLLFAGAAKADSFYTTTITTDSSTKGVVASASAWFSINASGQLVVVLSDTTNDPWQDSQNLGAISFQLQNHGSASFLTGTLVSISGNSISSTPLNTDLASRISSGGASLTTTPWTMTHGGTAVPTTNHIAYFAIGPNSMVGIPTTVGGHPEYTPGTCGSPLGHDGGCGSSKEFGQNSTDDPMIYETATFVFNLSSKPTDLEPLSKCVSAGQTCIDSVVFGFGPDGPDNDDVGTGVLCPTCTVPTATPEPGSLLLLGTGLLGMAGILRRTLLPRREVR